MKKYKKAIIFAGIIIVVIGLSSSAAIYFSNKQAEKAQQASDTPASTTPQRLPSEEKADDVDKEARASGAKEGAAAYDKAIESTQDNHEKFVFYSRKATLLFNENDLTGALSAATKAYELEKTSDSAAFVGQISQAKGDKTMALSYYKIAIERIDKTDPFADKDREYYTSIIVELEGSN